MTHDIIERYTGCARVSSFPPFITSLIIYTGRSSSVLLYEGIHDSIEFECGDARLDVGSYHVQCHSSEFSCLSDTFYLLGCFYENFWHFSKN